MHLLVKHVRVHVHCEKHCSSAVQLTFACAPTTQKVEENNGWKSHCLKPFPTCEELPAPIPTVILSVFSLFPHCLSCRIHFTMHYGNPEVADKEPKRYKSVSNRLCFLLSRSDVQRRKILIYGSRCSTEQVSCTSALFLKIPFCFEKHWKEFW